MTVLPYLALTAGTAQISLWSIPGVFAAAFLCSTSLSLVAAAACQGMSGIMAGASLIAFGAVLVRNLFVFM